MLPACMLDAAESGVLRSISGAKSGRQHVQSESCISTAFWQTVTYTMSRQSRCARLQPWQLICTDKRDIEGIHGLREYSTYSSPARTEKRIVRGGSMPMALAQTLMPSKVMANRCLDPAALLLHRPEVVKGQLCRTLARATWEVPQRDELA